MLANDATTSQVSVMKTISKTKRQYRLRVGASGPKPPFRPLTRLHHVAHLPTAIRILEDRTISARRVNDDSRLDEHRISVVWTAPNRWEWKGWRYGTVEFSFDFAELMQGRELYWVEGVDGRRLNTCRMLISDKDVRGLPLKRYDPTRSRGPIRLIDGTWFWRSDIEFELMVHGDLRMSRCDGIDVVPHNREHCSLGPAHRCGEVGRGEMETAAMLLAGALGGRYRLPDAPLMQEGRPSLLLQRGWHGILDALDDDMAGDIRRKEDVDLIVAAALVRLSSGDRHGAADLAALVSSAKRVRSSLARLLHQRAKVRIENPRADGLRLADPMPRAGIKELVSTRPGHRARRAHAPEARAPATRELGGTRSGKKVRA